MTRFEAIRQMARILGREEFAQGLGLPVDQLPHELTDEQTVALRVLAQEHIDDLVRALVEEAAL